MNFLYCFYRYNYLFYLYYSYFSVRLAMAAKIIAVVNQKGGVGKTTITMQVAGALGKRSHKVLVIDSDPQATAVRWASSASDETPFPASVIDLSATGSKLPREARKFVDDYDYIVIDCPPAAESAAPQSALLIADIGLIPVIPSPPDLWGSVGIRQVIERMAAVNDLLQSRIVVNQCQPNTSLAREAIEILPEYGIPVAASILHQRTAYRQAAVFGGTVHDLGYKAAAAIKEVDALVDEVISCLR